MYINLMICRKCIYLLFEDQIVYSLAVKWGMKFLQAQQVTRLEHRKEIFCFKHIMELLFSYFDEEYYIWSLS